MTVSLANPFLPETNSDPVTEASASLPDGADFSSFFVVSLPAPPSPQQTAQVIKPAPAAEIQSALPAALWECVKPEVPTKTAVPDDAPVKSPVFQAKPGAAPDTPGPALPEAALTPNSKRDLELSAPHPEGPASLAQETNGLSSFVSLPAGSSKVDAVPDPGEPVAKAFEADSRVRNEAGVGASERKGGGTEARTMEPAVPIAATDIEPASRQYVSVRPDAVPEMITPFEVISQPAAAKPLASLTTHTDIRSIGPGPEHNAFRLLPRDPANIGLDIQRPIRFEVLARHVREIVASDSGSAEVATLGESEQAGDAGKSLFAAPEMPAGDNTLPAVKNSSAATEHNAAADPAAENYATAEQPETIAFIRPAERHTAPEASDAASSGEGPGFSAVPNYDGKAEVRPTAEQPAAQVRENSEVTRQLEPGITELAHSIQSGEEKNSLKMRLSPAELGSVEITLVRNGDGSISAGFVTETDSAQSALAENLGQLRESLEGAGIQVEAIEIGCRSSSNAGQGGSRDSGHTAASGENLAGAVHDVPAADDDNGEEIRLVSLRA